MRVAVCMETSGHVREAFRRLGHYAISVDFLPSQDGGNHHQGDVFEFIEKRPFEFDLAIFHPECTFHTVSAAWAFRDPDFERYPGVGYHMKLKPGTKTGAERRAARQQAEADFLRIVKAPVRRKVIENPKGTIPTRLGLKPDQIVQPYEFGDDASKGTCFWYFDEQGQRIPSMRLPIDPSKRFPGRWVEYPKGSGNMVERWSNQTDSGQNNVTPSDSRWQHRSDTYPGIAEAMAAHWAGPAPEFI